MSNASIFIFNRIIKDIKKIYWITKTSKNYLPTSNWEIHKIALRYASY